jgi:hypothetical protein
MPSALITSEPVTIESTASDAPQPATDIAADAALVLAALSRLQTAARADRVALDRLRDSLGGLAYAIAQAKAMFAAPGGDEHKPDMTALLDQFEHQVDAMIDTAGGRAGATAVIPEPTQQAAVVEPPVVVHEELATTPAEADQVPTVSGVVSGLGNGEPELAASDAFPSAGSTPHQSPSVAELKAMVEALSAEPPLLTGEPPAPAAEDAAAPVETAGPPAEAALPIVEAALPPADVAPPEAAPDVPFAPPVDHTAETLAPAVEAAAPVEIATVPEDPSAEAAAPPPDLGMAEPAPPPVEAAMPPVEPEPPVEAAPSPPEPESQLVEAVLPPAELEPPPVGAVLPPPELEPPSVEAALPAVAAEAPAVEATSPAPEAKTFPWSIPQGNLVIADLLASYQQMEARPIPPPDEGTAVIFAPRTEPFAAPIEPVDTSSVTIEPQAPTETAAAPIMELAPSAEIAEAPAATAVVPSPAAEVPPPAAETPPIEQTVAEAMLTDPDFDPSDLLFGPDPEPDPAAFLLEPEPPQTTPPQPATAAEQQPPAEPARDPLAPLKAMSEAERIAIFS